MEFIKTNKGSRKVINAGHAYCRQKKTKTTIRWVCSQIKKLKCSGAIITDLSMTEILSSVEHSHVPNYDYIKGLKIRCSIKSTVKANQGIGKLSQIVTDSVHKNSPQIIVAAGSINALKQVNVSIGIAHSNT